MSYRCKVRNSLVDLDLNIDHIRDTVHDLTLVLNQLDSCDQYSKEALLSEVKQIQMVLDAVKVCLDLRIDGAKIHLGKCFAILRAET